MSEALQMSVDPARAEAFAGRMLEILNGGALAVMTSIGHRTRLFDVMAEIGPATSRQIAEAARLEERYVREWLGAVATGRIVEHDPEDGTFRLPPEHAASLTRAAAPANLAASMQFLPVLGSVEESIVECFRNGGGVPYEAFPRFHEVMEEESAQTVVAGLFEHVLPLIPGIEEDLRRGIEVLDVGCGRALALRTLARRFPRSRFTGYDFSAEAVAHAREEAARAGLENVTIEVRDAAKIEDSDRFDLITTFDAVHDQADPARVLANIHRALRRGGRYLMQDIAASSHVGGNLDHPLAPFIYTVSCMHCMTVSLAHGGAGLGAAWGKELALSMLSEAGFARVEVKTLPHDIQNYWYLTAKE